MIKSHSWEFAWYVLAADFIFFPIVFLSQETLHLTCRKDPCFAKFSEMEKMANIQAEINEVQPLLLSMYAHTSVLRNNTWHVMRHQTAGAV